MKKIVLLVLLVPGLIQAQSITKELEFIEEDHDFGIIKEVDGPAEYKFEFTNTSDNPVTITNVRASCGCTTPAWTREPVNSGGKGFITAVYNPRNRPGPFHKTLTVTTSGQNNTIILRIQGKVEPKPRTIEDDYRSVMGDLRTEYRAINVGKVYNNAPAKKIFKVYNQGDNDLVFQNNIEAPEYIKIRFEPQTLKPKEKGTIIIDYDSRLNDELGFINSQVTIYTNEPQPQNKKVFTVYADQNEYFAPLTSDAAAVAPKLSIEKRIHDFGKINQGDVVTTTYPLKNMGKNTLMIRKITSNCDCAVVSFEKKELITGEKIDLEVTFNSTGRRGTQQKSVTIYTNDPVTPVQRVILKASVQVQSN